MGDVLLDTTGRCAVGCASSTHLGVNKCPNHAMPISVDPLGERPILAEAAPEDWLDRRDQCALNLIIGNVIIPKN